MNALRFCNPGQRPMRAILGRSVILSTCLLFSFSCSKEGKPSNEAVKGTNDTVQKNKQKAAKDILAASPSSEAFYQSNGKEKRIRIEVVSTPQGIQQGLMYRRNLAEDAGMLFVFSEDRIRSFWMKNTLLPLDMLFIDNEGKVVGIEKNTKPLSLDSRSVGIPARYVLEVNAGYCDREGVKVGSVFRFENLPPIGSPPP